MLRVLFQDRKTVVLTNGDTLRRRGNTTKIISWKCSCYSISSLGESWSALTPEYHRTIARYPRTGLASVFRSLIALEQDILGVLYSYI